MSEASPDRPRFDRGTPLLRRPARAGSAMTRARLGSAPIGRSPWPGACPSERAQTAGGTPVPDSRAFGPNGPSKHSRCLSATLTTETAECEPAVRWRLNMVWNWDAHDGIVGCRLRLWQGVFTSWFALFQRIRQGHHGYISRKCAIPRAFKVEAPRAFSNIPPACVSGRERERPLSEGHPFDGTQGPISDSSNTPSVPGVLVSEASPDRQVGAIESLDEQSIIGPAPIRSGYTPYFISLLDWTILADGDDTGAPERCQSPYDAHLTTCRRGKPAAHPLRYVAAFICGSFRVICSRRRKRCSLRAPGERDRERRLGEPR